MRPLFIAAIAALVACNDKDVEDTSSAEPADHLDSDACDPLTPEVCALPYPSSYFMTEDTEAASGYRVAFAETSLPKNRDGYQITPEFWNEKDGFSISGPLLAFFEEASADGLIGSWSIGDYADADATTVIVDAATGERVPHWAEFDDTAPDASQRLLVLRPAQPFEHGTRYVVGIRGLVDTSGAPVAARGGFAALRDGSESADTRVEGMRDHFESVVFPTLEGAGVDRGELQLAWDFVTASREDTIGRTIHIRDDAAAAYGDGGPAYTIDEIEDGDCSAEGTTIGRTIYGEMTVPLYMEEDKPGVVLTRGDDGLPYQNGTTQVEFMVRIPCSVIADPKPSFILQYGHGLLGDLGEARSGYMGEMLNDHGWVLGAVSWTGMKEEDSSYITYMLVDHPSRFAIIPERSQQGFIEFDAMLRMMRGDLATDDAVTFEGVSVLDPDRFGYYGNSQGGILGGGYLGMSAQLERGVLGVPGAPYSLLLTRSVDFDDFFKLFHQKFTDQKDIILCLTLFQTLWDPSEGAGWLRATTEDPAEGTPTKQVLLHAAIGDAQVTTLGAHYMARAYGATTVAPQTRALWDIDEQEPGFSGSALVEWAYSDVPDEPLESIPPEGETDTHECPRRELAAQEQIRDFLEDGVVNQYCDGVCENLRAGLCD